MNLNIQNRMGIAYVRNPAKAGAVRSDLAGVRVIIEAGRVAAVDEAELTRLGKLVDKVDKKALDSQEAEDEKKRKAAGG